MSAAAVVQAGEALLKWSRGLRWAAFPLQCIVVDHDQW